MLEVIAQGFAEFSVAEVEVEEVGDEIVVADIQIHQAVAVEIAGCGAEPVTHRVHSCRFADVDELAIFVLVHALAVPAVLHHGTAVGNVHAFEKRQGMVGHETVEITVVVHIEEGSLGGMALIGKSIGRCLFGKGSVFVVDVQEVSAISRVLVRTAAADIDIEPAVVVQVDHVHPRTPSCWRYAGSLGDLFKLEFALVEIDFRRTGITGEDQIVESVVIQVAGCNSATVVSVVVYQLVHAVAFGEFIHEGNTGFSGRHQLKHTAGSFLTTFFITGCSRHAQQQSKQDASGHTASLQPGAHPCTFPPCLWHYFCLLTAG